MKQRNNKAVFPIYIFEIGLVLGPILYVVLLSFMTRTDSWDVIYRFTLENYAEIFKPLYFSSFMQSLGIAITTTLICIILGYPAGLIMARMDAKWQSFFVTANMLPFLFNSMMRICGLIIILRSGGILDSLLSGIGIEGVHILYSYGAVVIGMVYVLMPMMIYCVYSAASRIANDNTEAARIMGASQVRAFIDVTLPLTAGGLLNGVVLCFIPAMGLYIISSLLGGGKIMLISNVIEDHLLKVHNLPFSAALAVVLMLITAGFVALSKVLDPVRRKQKKAHRLMKQVVPQPDTSADVMCDVHGDDTGKEVCS